jgi:hypothetical protein
MAQPLFISVLGFSWLLLGSLAHRRFAQFGTRFGTRFVEAAAGLPQSISE